MEIVISVTNQKLKIATNQNYFVEGSQEFVKFVFQLSDEWTSLSPFAQFVQDENAYSVYLDSDDWSCYLPNEITEGTCLLMLYGTAGDVIGTTNAIELNIDECHIVSDASSTEITQSLYNQLVAQMTTYTGVINSKQDQIQEGTITLSTTWSGSDPYYQQVTVTGVTTTENSLITLQPSDEQLDQLDEDKVLSLRIDNNAGTLTAYARGGYTTESMTIQCTVTELAEGSSSGSSSLDLTFTDTGDGNIVIALA